MKAHTFAKLCPVDPAHGAVVALTSIGRWGWYCPNAAHDGRLDSHPLGGAPRTRAFFTTAEVDRGSIESEPVAVAS